MNVLGVDRQRKSIDVGDQNTCIPYGNQAFPVAEGCHDLCLAQAGLIFFFSVRIIFAYLKNADLVLQIEEYFFLQHQLGEERAKARYRGSGLSSCLESLKREGGDDCRVTS